MTSNNESLEDKDKEHMLRELQPRHKKAVEPTMITKKSLYPHTKVMVNAFYRVEIYGHSSFDSMYMHLAMNRYVSYHIYYIVYKEQAS